MKRVPPPKAVCIVACVGCGRLRKLGAKRKIEDPPCKGCGGPLHLLANQDAIMAAFLMAGREGVLADMVEEPWLRGKVAAWELEQASAQDVKGLDWDMMIIDEF